MEACGLVLCATPLIPSHVVLPFLWYDCEQHCRKSRRDHVPKRATTLAKTGACVGADDTGSSTHVVRTGNASACGQPGTVVSGDCCISETSLWGFRGTLVRCGYLFGYGRVLSIWIDVFFRAPRQFYGHIVVVVTMAVSFNVVSATWVQLLTRREHRRTT